jgi:hypothetical protein
MSKAFESIMRGLNEIEAHQKGAAKLRTRILEIEPAPRNDAKEMSAHL